MHTSIPRPFQARGISVEEFLRKQEEIIERFDSGFDGYRGLNGESIEYAKRNMSAQNPRQFPDAYNIPFCELHNGRCTFDVCMVEGGWPKSDQRKGGCEDLVVRGSKIPRIRQTLFKHAP